MIQFKEEDIYRLIQACSVYQERTGSEYMWDEYEKLKDKLLSYREEISTD